ncbi:MAG TPA: metallophosphoesterase [Actinomycetota bacterium]|nr:metallophosphoesterase [Actinomycetota bacterium]
MARIVTFALSVTFTLATVTPAEAVHVVVAGDIGSSGSGDTQTADRVIALDPDFVLTVGDHAYPDGTGSQFNRYYEPTWGRFRSITRPSPGNHDWMTRGAAGYESYFHVQAGRVRSFVLGSWLVVSLDSNVRIARQRTRLATVLSSDDRRCELLFFHHPRWSSGQNGNQQGVAAWWRTAYANGVDVILNGHDHDYERFARKRPSGRVAADGIREFVVGMGGVETRSFSSRKSGSQKRITGNDNWGVLDLALRPGAYRWRFIDADSGDRLDAGLSRCHA